MKNVSTTMAESTNETNLFQKYRMPGIILIIGFLHGIIYTFIIPPWQHYDEPSQFEYAWLVAQRGKLPDEEDFSHSMLQEVAASMIEHAFFKNKDFRPNLLSLAPRIWSSQLRDRPAYFILTAIPLFFLRYADVTTQLYVGRLFSLFMYLSTLIIAYRLMTELTSEKSHLRWMIPVSIALTPAFTDLMTAINNDVGATLAFSLFLWLGTRILIHGFTPLRLLTFVGVTTICYFTKINVIIAVPLAAILLILLITRAPKPWKWLPIPFLLGILIIGGLTALSWGDTAYWYRNSPIAQQDLPTQIKTADAPHERSSIQIRVSTQEKQKLVLSQPIEASTVNRLRGDPITLGAWVWASEPLEIRSPALWVDGNYLAKQSRITTTPTFLAVSGTIPKNTKLIRIVLDPQVQSIDQSVTIYYDGIVLAEGLHPQAEGPIFNDPKGYQGIWGEEKFDNLARNPSAENSWVIIKPATYQFISKFISALPFHSVSAIQDYQAMGNIYFLSLKNLFQSFWARFGWNHIRLPNIWYRFLALITVISMAGILWGFIETWQERALQWKIAVLWLILAGGLIWVAAIMRLELPVWNSNVFIPSARYAYPAITPTMFVFVAGWRFIINRLPYQHIGRILLVFSLVVLDIFSLITIFKFYDS